MNNMDEITYWIYTKRAPCLLSYDNTFSLKCTNNYQDTETLSCSQRKRKLSLLNNSVITEEEKNILNKESQNVMHKIDLRSSDSETKNLSLKKDLKRKRNSRDNTHKGDVQILTSTPKATKLVSQNNIKKVSRSNHLNYDGSCPVNLVHAHSPPNNHDQSNNLKMCNDDASDVSGFTANYIRSTKIKCKNKHNNMRRLNKIESVTKPSLKNGNKTVLCVDKSTNTRCVSKTVLNSSTDSSQNIINLVTKSTNKKCDKVDKSTSQIKINEKINDSTAPTETNTTGVLSRYPKRTRNNSKTNFNEDASTNKCVQNDDQSYIKTRSGKYIRRCLDSFNGDYNDSIHKAELGNSPINRINVSKLTRKTRNISSKSVNRNRNKSKISQNDSCLVATFSESREHSKGEHSKYFD